MIGPIENAIVARIKAASEANTLGYSLRTIGTYGAEFDAEDDDLIQLIKNQFPAVWVTFLDEALQDTGNKYKIVARFAVLCAARSLRNEQARRHGGAAGEIGSYQIMRDIRALLADQDLGLDIDPLTPLTVRTLFNGGTQDLKASVLTIEFKTAYYEERGPAPAGLADFQTFHADWDVPPHGNVMPPLPTANPDAQDTVTMETAP